MKSIQIFTIVFLLVFNACAQRTIQPPTPPTPPNSSTSVSVSSSSSSSISISSTNSRYKFRASFHASKRKEVERALRKTLKNIQLKEKRGKLIWLINKGGEIAFECKLYKNKVRMYLNKEALSNNFIDQIQDLGKEIKNYISGNSVEDIEIEEGEIRISDAEERLEMAKKELKNAIENLEQAKRKSDN